MPAASSLRLLVVLGLHPSRTETFLARDLAALRALGHTVEVAAFGAEGDPDPAAIYRPDWRDLAGWSPLARRVNSLLPVVGSCLGGAAVSWRLRLRWLRNLGFAAALAERTSRRPYDLVVAGWSSLPAQVAWMSHRLGGAPYVVLAHARDVFAAPEALPAALAEARGIAVCNRAALARLAARRPELASRLAWCPHGLPLADWPRRDAEPEGEPVVLGVGRLVEKKGFDVLVEATGQLRPSPHLVILGDGPERSRLAELAAACGVRLTIPGHVGSETVAAWLRRSRALCLPSRIDREGDRDGLANVILEAMAVGLPVLTTTAGSAQDAVRHGRTGWLVPTAEPGLLAAALERLLADGTLRASLAAGGRAMVEQHYDLTRNAARLARWLAAAADRGTRC